MLTHETLFLWQFIFISKSAESRQYNTQLYIFFHNYYNFLLPFQTKGKKVHSNVISFNCLPVQCIVTFRYLCIQVKKGTSYFFIRITLSVFYFRSLKPKRNSMASSLLLFLHLDQSAFYLSCIAHAERNLNQAFQVSREEVRSFGFFNPFSSPFTIVLWIGMQREEDFVI